MFSSKKAISGLKSKVNGQQFENLFEYHALKFGASVTKIPSGCRWVTQFKAIAVETPFDFLICYNGLSIFVDTKTVESKTFSKSRIKENQAKELFKIEQKKCLAGYVIWFKDGDEIVFFKASQLIALNKDCSLKAIDGIRVGSAKGINFGELFNEATKQVILKTTS